MPKLNQNYSLYSSEREQNIIFKGCVFECALRTTTAKLNCTPWHLIYTDLDQAKTNLCDGETTLKYEVTFSKMMNKPPEQCQCPPDCQSISYKVDSHSFLYKVSFCTVCLIQYSVILGKKSILDFFTFKIWSNHGSSSLHGQTTFYLKLSYICKCENLIGMNMLNKLNNILNRFI